MSLKSFHLFFISLSVLLSAGVAGWGFVLFVSGAETLGLIVGLFFALFGGALIFYELRFIRNFKHVSNL